MNPLLLKKRSILTAAAGISLLTAAIARCDPGPTTGNPETNASDRNYDRSQPNSAPGTLQKANDGGNRGLNKVDETTHKVIRKVNAGARHGTAKTKRAWNKATAPANKPAQP
jgi:hypothetical protein